MTKTKKNTGKRTARDKDKIKMMMRFSVRDAHREIEELSRQIANTQCMLGKLECEKEHMQARLIELTKRLELEYKR